MKISQRLFRFVLFGLLPLALCAQSETLLDTLTPGHPRLLIKDDRWATIKARAETDPLLKAWIAKLTADADRLKAAPPLERRQEGRRLLAVSREALGRITLWAMARHLNDDVRYAERAKEEMLQLVRFRDWNPSHFLDVAEMTAAVAIGYDWLYYDLSEAERGTIRKGLIRLGLEPGLRAIQNGAGWLTRENNWNQVCLSGLTIGSLVVADTNPELASEILTAARENSSNGLGPYAPDGVYPEGPGYWSYGTAYQCMMIDALRTALGTSWAMEQSPGFLESARAQVQLVGPTGRFFNFADNGEGPRFQTPLVWFARELDQPELLDQQRAILKHQLSEPPRLWLDVFAVIWWPDSRSATSPAPLPLTWHGDGANPVAIFRSSWTDPDALYLACTGGKGTVPHGHLDAGSFVLEAKGQRWAVDLGLQSYHSLESKGIRLWERGQDGQRWQIFRLNNRSHNTLTINDALHRVDGMARFTHFDASSAEIDLSAVFADQADRVSRRFEFSENQVVIVDQLEGLQARDKVRWTMATRADVEIRGNQAILKQEGEQMRVRLRSPGGRLSVMPADPPDDGFNAPNPETYLLIADLIAPATGGLNIEMQFEPISPR